MDPIDILIRNIKQLMRDHGIKNNTQLSAKMEEAGLSYSQPNIHRLMNKESKNVELVNLIKLATFFDVTVGQLIGTEPLQSTISLPANDEFKRQLKFIYHRLDSDNKEKLVMHAQLLLTAQGVSDPISVPYPVPPKTKVGVDQ